MPKAAAPATFSTSYTTPKKTAVPPQESSAKPKATTSTYVGKMKMKAEAKKKTETYTQGVENI